MKFLSGNHIMVDCETLSTKPDAALLSIGAVKFRFDKGIQNEFYINVDPSSCKTLGMRIEKDTVAWWSKQSKEALAAFKSPAPTNLYAALEAFSEFCGDNTFYLWSNGAGFDAPILEIAYAAIQKTSPWKYYNVMCYRTVMNILGLSNNKLRKDQGGLHNALADARGQAEILIDAFK